MVAGDLVTLPPVEGGPLHDVHARAVVTLHVEVAAREAVRTAIAAEVARDGERLEEDLGHDHRAAEVEHDAAVVEADDRVREPAEVAMAGVADRGTVGGRMLVDDLGAERGVHGDGHAEPMGVEDHRELGVNELPPRHRDGDRLAHPHLVPHPGDERVVQLAAGLLGHPEGAVPEAGGDVLRGAAEAGDLVVVDRRRSVHGEMRDHATLHEVHEHRREAGLHHVAAEHDDHAALAPVRGGDGVDDGEEVAGDEDVGERAQKRAEGAVAPRRGRELLGAHLVRTAGDRDGANGREVGLAARGGVVRH